jgi:hypothetical protein
VLFFGPERMKSSRRSHRLRKRLVSSVLLLHLRHFLQVLCFSTEGGEKGTVSRREKERERKKEKKRNKKKGEKTSCGLT